MALSALLRRLLKTGLANGAVAKELADAVDAATNQATNATPTNITATNATVTNLTATNATVTNATVTNSTVTTQNVTNSTVGTRLTFADNGNAVFNATTGTMLGTNNSQKAALWGATPVVQPSGTGELLGLSGNAATAANATNMNSNGNIGATNYGFNDVVKALKQAGVIKS